MRVVKWLLWGGVWFMVWFPLGIVFTVRANENSTIVKFLATLKGIWSLFV